MANNKTETAPPSNAAEVFLSWSKISFFNAIPLGPEDKFMDSIHFKSYPSTTIRMINNLLEINHLGTVTATSLNNIKFIKL